MARAFLLPTLCAACLLAGCGGGAQPGAPQAAKACDGGVCVSTVAGSGEFATADGPAADAAFFMPHALAFDASAQLHVADYGGDSQTRLLSGNMVFSLAEDATEFPIPSDVVTDAAGNRYVADTYNNRILEITPAGTTSVLAGTGQSGDQDGDGATASFSLPAGLAFDAQGALYVADMGNHKIRRITFPAG